MIDNGNKIKILIYKYNIKGLYLYSALVVANSFIKIKTYTIGK